MNTGITSEEQENGCFGAYGNEIPSISHSEFSFDMHQGVIHEDYGLIMYSDTIDGNFSPPSAINNEMTNLENIMSCPCDNIFHSRQRAGVVGHETSQDEPASDTIPGVLAVRNYTKTDHCENKNGLHRGSGKSLRKAPKSVNKSVRELLKAFSILHPSASKDRHTRVATSRGVRDRRIRLSFETSIKFFLVQDRLGFDQPSQAMEWLIENCRPAIDELPRISPSELPANLNSFSPYMGADLQSSKEESVMEKLGLPACIVQGPNNNGWTGEQVAGSEPICSCLDPYFNYSNKSMQSMESFAGLISTTLPPCTFPSNH